MYRFELPLQLCYIVPLAQCDKNQMSIKVSQLNYKWQYVITKQGLVNLEDVKLFKF